MEEDQKSTWRLWNEKDPRWLLNALRALAPHRDFAGKYEYLAQFARGEVPDLDARIDAQGFAKRFHLSDPKFLDYLSKEAEEYRRVFDKQNAELLYKNELIKQVREHLPHVNIPGKPLTQNLLYAVVVSTMRDLSLVEDLHRTGELNDEEHGFALREINTRMDRVGLNGLGRMLVARPELHEFLAGDTRSMDARHIRPTSNVRKERTRAACYAQLSERHIRYNENADSKSFESDLEDVIGKDFHQIRVARDRQVESHSTPSANQEPSDKERRIFAKEAILPSAEVMASEAWEVKASQLTKEAFRGDQAALALADYLLFDGIAANHPERETYAGKLRDRMGMEGEVISETVAIPRQEIEAGGSGQAAAEEDVEDAIVIEESSAPSSKREIEASSAGKGDVVDAEIIEESTTSTEKENKAPGANNDQGAKAKEDDIVDAEIIEEKEAKSTEAAEGKKTGSGTKIATISAGATAVGLLMSASSGKETGGESKEKDNSRALKFAAAAGALAVAVGGAILWSRKPEALYKTLSNLSLGGHGRG